MGKLTGLEQMEKMFQKVEDTKEQYAVVLENAEKEVAELKVAIAEGEQHLQEIYKNYVLGIVEIGAYQSEQKAVNDKKAILQIAENKVADIDGLLKAELLENYNEIMANTSDFTIEHSANYELQRKKMFSAKVDYLRAMGDAKIERDKTGKYIDMIKHLQVEAGVKKELYTDYGEGELNALLRNQYTRTEGLEVDRDDVKSAYRYGHVPMGVLGYAGLA